MNDRLTSLKSTRLQKALAVCLFAMLTACAEDDPQKYIQEGRSLFEKGDMDSARVQFQNALQIQPKLSDAYYGLALIAEDKKDWKAMFGALQETVALDPKHVDARVKLGQLYMLQGKIDDARAQVVSALQLAPESIDAMILESALLSRDGKNGEALQKINQVLAKDQGNADAIISQATILFAEQRQDEALASVQKGIELHPDKVDLRLLRIRLLTERKQFDDVIKEFEALIVAHPNEQPYRMVLGDLLISLGKSDQAEKVLHEAIDKAPADAALKLRLVALVERRDTAEAESMLKGFAAERPEDLQLKSSFARFYADRGRAEEERSILDAIATADPKGKEGLAAKVRLAEIAWGNKDRETTEKLIEEVIAVDAGNNEALLLRSGLRIDSNDADGAISDLRILLRDQPNSDKAMVMMGQAYALKGETEVAESHWRKALEIAPSNVMALVPMTAQLVKRNDIARAEELVDKAAKASPANPAILELLIQVKAAKKDWKGAEATVTELSQLPRGQIVAELWRGLLAADRGEHKAAIGHFRTVLDQQPNFAKVWKALADAYQATGKSEELLAYLNGFIESHPDNAAAYTLLASTYVQEQQWGNAEKALAKAVEKAPHDMELKLRLVNLIDRRSQPEAEALLKQYAQDKPQDLSLKSRLAAYFTAHQRASEAEAILKEIALVDSVGRYGQIARLRLAQSALRKQDLPAATTLIEEVLKVDADNTEALLLRAGIRMDDKDFDGAIGDLQRIVQIRPDADRAMLMLAQAYLENGDSAASETQLRKILEFDPGNFQALAPLVTQMRKRGETESAEALLEKANKAAPSSPQIAELLVQFKAAKKDWAAAQAVVDALKKQTQSAVSGEMLDGTLAAAQGRYADAINAYQKVLSKQPNEDQALGALARVYVAAGQQNEMVKFLEIFIRQQPESLAAHNSLGLAYAALKQWDKAEKVLRQTVQRQPKSIATVRVLADVLAKQGKDAEVETVFKSAIAKTPDFPALSIELAKFYELTRKPDEAIAVYQSVVEKYPDNLQAANNLADLLVNYRDDQDSIRQALELTERFKDTTNPYFLDTYGWVMLKAGHNDEALESLKKAVKAVPELAPIRYHLGEAFYVAGDTAAASTQFQKALELSEQQGDFKGIERVRELQQRIQGVVGKS